MLLDVTQWFWLTWCIWMASFSAESVMGENPSFSANRGDWKPPIWGNWLLSNSWDSMICSSVSHSPLFRMSFISCVHILVCACACAFRFFSPYREGVSHKNLHRHEHPWTAQANNTCWPPCHWFGSMILFLCSSCCTTSLGDDAGTLPEAEYKCLQSQHRQPPKKHNHNGTGVYLRPCSIDPDSPVGNTSIVCAENSSAVLSILVGNIALNENRPSVHSSSTKFGSLSRSPILAQ